MPKIQFINYDGTPGKELVVDVPPGTTILEAAEEHGAHVGSACGGNLACSTCHVWVHRGLDSLGDIEEGEDDILDKAFDVREESRLGCQCRLTDEDITVEITPESLRAWLDEHPDARKQVG